MWSCNLCASLRTSRNIPVTLLRVLQWFHKVQEKPGFRDESIMKGLSRVQGLSLGINRSDILRGKSHLCKTIICIAGPKSSWRTAAKSQLCHERSDLRELYNENTD